MGFGLPGKKRNQAKGFAKSENKSEKSDKKQRWPRATFPLEGIKTPSVIGFLGAQDAHQLHEFLQSLLQSNLHIPHISEAIQGIVAGFCPTIPTPVTPPTPFDGNFYPPEIGYGGGVNLPPAPEINVGGAVGTLPPPVLLPIDPVTGLPKAGVNNSEAIAITQIPPVNLTLAQPKQTIDLTQIFTSKLGGQLYYEIIGGNSDSLEVKIAGSQLQLTALGEAGVNNVAITVMDSYGNFSTANLSVTTDNLNPEMAVKPRPNIKESLHHLTAALEQNPENLLAGFETPEGEQALEDLTGLLEKNPDLLQFLTQPESLSQLGVSERSIETLTKLLKNQELAAEFGLSVTLGEALSKPDSNLFDNFLMDADGAIDLLPLNAKQPKIGFIDFTEGQHIQHVTNTFSTINPLANYDSFLITNGDWAARLVEFVNRAKASGETHAIVNMSFDLSQLDDVGITTRYELTPAEQEAIQYARKNNVLLVVASGNTGGVMSALGQASKRFDNIITVGAVNQFESKTDYSGYGNGLTLMAPGGSWNRDPNAFVGTSKATSYVTAAASLVWAANPDLSWQQVKQLLIDSAADLNAPGWDETTGFGLINVKEAIRRAQLIAPDLSGVKPVSFTPSRFSGEGRVETLARPTSEETEKAITLRQQTQYSLLEQWQTLADLGNPALTLADLDGEVKQKITAALSQYQQVSTDAGITTAQAQQWAEALALATQHYQIEKARLQTLLQQQKELQAQLAALGQQKSALEAETQKILADIQKQIGVAESDLAKTKEKLINPFADLGVPNGDDPAKILQTLQQKIVEQQNITQNNSQQSILAEQRRLQNQNRANWYNSQIYRWEVVGTRRTGRSGRNVEPVYGWVYHPENLAPRDQAQSAANLAASETQHYAQLAQQAQQQATAFSQQAEKLQLRLKDLPSLTQGIEYEIAADSLRLQAEKDLLALHTPVQQQKLETLNLQISQAEEQLQTLENQKIPTQQQATDSKENRLKATQTEVEAIQTKRAVAQKNLQNFLETAGFLLPYRERLTAVQKTVEQLETEKLNVQSVMQQLVNLMLQTPSDSLLQQLNYWNDHLATLNQELDWAKLQQNQLALAIADSPERLAISGLIKELETAPASINPTAKIEKLKLMEGSGNNFLEGFDNLPQRLADAKAEETQTQKDLDKLNREYREFGLQKANLQDNLIPGKEKEIAAKEQQIAGTESAIAKTQGTLNSLQIQLTQTQDSLAQKSAEVQQQEGLIASTQSQLANLQNQIVAKNSEIQQQQSVAQGNQNQINQANAAVNWLEQQRQAHQSYANYWNSQIYTWGVVGNTGGKHSRPIYGSIYNPQAEANRNAAQSYANSYAQQRDVAQVNAQQLTATLQPQIAVNQQQIATLQQQQQSLTQQQQALNSQLANQQTQLQQLQKELQAITQQANNLQSQINQTQNQLNGLNTQLGNQQQQREDLIAQLGQLNQQKSDLEQKLIDKYREIELTDKYFEQVEAEVNRLQNRLDLLNKAGVIEQKYQQNWQSWQDATQAQATATQALLEIRKAGQPDRDRLAFLQQQLKDTQGNLDRVKSIQKSITDAQQTLEFTKLQLGNQTLLLQSLIDRENSLAALERSYLNEAEAQRQKIWQWNGSSYFYNAAVADAYRASFQQGSFIADQRNRLWKQRQETLAKINELNQKISQQTLDIAKHKSELANLGQSIPQIESQLTTLQGEIAPVSKRLEPLQLQENKQAQIIQGATATTQNLASQLSQTTELHSTALRQLIGFGILASESDVDFFATQVEPQVNTHLEQLKNVGNDLGNAIDSQNQQIANWEQALANTQDDISKQALTNLIAQAKTQLGNLETLKASNQTNANELEDLLNQATKALIPLRQKQELEIRKKLESNDGRLESLQSQLNSENAADAAIKSGTVLDHVLLANQINQDLRLGATNWKEQFLAGNQQTKELVTHQQELSNSFDEEIAYINDKLAEPDGNYNRTHTDLANAITTLGVVENRADVLDTTFTSTEDAIEKIKLRIEQDAKLWEEIAPIAIRYGVESKELQEYQTGVLQFGEQAKQFEKERLQHQANADWWNGQINSKGLGFDENFYLAQNPDVAAAVAKGAFRSGYEHFIKYGQFEGRNPSAQFDNSYYLAKNPDVAAAVARGELRSGVEHFVKYGQFEGRAHNPQAEANRNAEQVAANTAAQQHDLYLQKLEDARKVFLAKYPDNGTAIDLLKAATLEGENPNQEISNLLNNPSADVLLNAEAVEGRNPNQSLFDKAKAEQASHEAQGYAALAQAAWYEQQAAYNWAVSRKNGPFWYEQRCAGKRRRRHCWMEQHVDYNWMLWQQYSQIFPQLRAQGYAHLVEADKWRKEKERIEPLKNQWVATNDAANQAEPPIDEARNLFAELETAHQSIPGDQVQLASLENLLPIIKQQLEQAEAEAVAQNAKVEQEWDEYDTNSEEYRAAIADILQRRGELNTKAIEAQQQLADAEANVERQTVALSDELTSTKSLSASLENQLKSLQNQIITLHNQGVSGGALDDLNTNLVQINQSLKLLNNKAAVLTAEQTALTQKRTMLTAQNEVILAEQRLLDAYINDPDADYSNLQQQLDDARAALAEAQRLAEQAEAASQALTASLQQLKTDLLAQNDEHLKAAKEHQAILKDLVEATQSNANYTLQAAQKQQEVNSLEFQIIQRLQQATAAGNQEAKALLEVAQHNDMATAAEIYYRDYSDLAGDKGSKGSARPEDKMLADNYYQQMLNNRELQRRAQVQADAFRVAKETAQAQMNTLQGQQETAQQLLNDLNTKVAETQAEREKKEQELAIAQARLDGITRIREQTEQTFIQLVTLEKLNLAQAQLEQEIAQSHQAEIDEAVQERMERDRLELERKRLETTAKIEQLKQLQAEDELRQSLNNVRGDLGLATLDPTEDPMQLQTQLAGLLTSLKDLETQQPDLPDDVKALLAEARGDIHLALQGKEAANIQESLLSAMDGMIGQIESYKGEINRIDSEEELDNYLLQMAQTDLQGASKQFLEELQEAEELSGEKQIIDPLYQEALIKIAYAEQAVDISEDLAKQGKEMLDAIIEKRVAERKARKKAFWNKILGIISGVIGLLSAITFFIPGLQPLSIILGAASAGINAIQSIINGDWLGGIFSIVMAGVNALTAGMGNALSKGAQLAIQGLKSVATGAFNGVRSMMSGDNIMGFLQILGGVAGAASSGLSSFLGQCSPMIQKMMVQVFNSLQSVPTMIYSGIESIKNGDWFSAIGNIFNSVITLGTNFAGVFNSTAGKVFEYLGKIGNTGLAIGGAIKEGSIEGWLSGITSIIGMWGPDIANLVDRLNGEPIDPTYYEYSEESLEPNKTCSASSG
ncbi:MULTISPECIES: S8 family serine peptidase [unclassified Microcoleus]|uniref:S8 family serine peptidase n=1 Tax=unclassified Microcoleus TaxID=2642155 RepID=UPI002FD266F6